MDNPYSTIITVLVFIAIYQWVVKRDAPPILAALIAIGLPYAINIVTRLFFASVMQIEIFPISEIIETVIGFGIYIVVFKNIRNTKSPLAAGVWGVTGFIFVAVALPALVSGLYNLVV